MTSEAELADIANAIHDEYVDVDSISHDAGATEVRLTLYPCEWRKAWIGWNGKLAKPLPPPLGQLVVRNVVQMALRDDAESGFVTVNKLYFDARIGQLRFEAHQPVEITFDVSGLSVDLLISQLPAEGTVEATAP